MNDMPERLLEPDLDIHYTRRVNAEKNFDQPGCGVGTAGERIVNSLVPLDDRIVLTGHKS